MIRVFPKVLRVSYAEFGFTQPSHILTEVDLREKPKGLLSNLLD